MQIWYNNACLCKLVSGRSSWHTLHTFHTNFTSFFFFFSFIFLFFIYNYGHSWDSLLNSVLDLTRARIYISYEWPYLRLSAQLSLKSWSSISTHIHFPHISHISLHFNHIMPYACIFIILIFHSELQFTFFTSNAYRFIPHQVAYTHRCQYS